MDNPDALTDGTRTNRYQEYEFTTFSRTRSGKLRELSTHFGPDGDTLGTRIVIAKQPTARVGNIASGKGTVVINDDKVYETYSDEDPRRFTIEFTAAGPMWASEVRITFPADLDALDTADVMKLTRATGSIATSGTPSGNSGYFSIRNLGSSEISFSGVNPVEVNEDS